jgi:hypothetical protein
MHISDREKDLSDAVIGKMLKIVVEDKSIISLAFGEPDFVEYLSKSSMSNFLLLETVIKE